MRRGLLLIAVGFVVCGCVRSKSGTTSPATSPKSSGGDVGFGAVQKVRGAVQRAVTQNEMKGLHLFIENASAATGRMPTKDQVMDTVKKEDAKLYQFLQDGLIVLTDIKTREGIWAFEKDAATNGGFILSQNGVERLTADEVKSRMAGQ